MATNNAATGSGPLEEFLQAIGLLVLQLLKLLAVIVWWAVLFPMVSMPLGGAVAAGLLLGWSYGFALVGGFIAAMVAWRLRSPRTFQRWITGRARTRLLSWWRYRCRWTQRLTACKLTIPADDGKNFVPRLLGVVIGQSSDRVRVRMLDGQCPADWDSRTDRLAHAFGALDCQAAITGPGVIELSFRHRDSLADPIELPRPDTRFRKDAA